MKLDNENSLQITEYDEPTSSLPSDTLELYNFSPYDERGMRLRKTFQEEYTGTELLWVECQSYKMPFPF